ncbi:AraC family transcriptional regulator [Anaerocolumna cellulosilytica]|uniref:AraC family transcriptional regulator n=1 Tax=Anaerocolumna cellulosilytica TaxID=433286 RepID=A0A6S6R184_9FIRM|nr:AraC family transcriptional regulator [Anaerocolumna cellulosilytica]MBB5196780.1 AraC family transcriptional regulator [Anaerocolumna cellulosilytica]BCJ95826.1 AraC family transcriptional regulator [Anaerocolumna cellulosilytica]
MESWECIEKVTGYIEENLNQGIRIETLAEIANLSPFYFQKLFKRLVNKTPMEYVKLRRLARIAEELKENSTDNLLTICLKYGFETHETFSRSFKEAYKITPSEYRANPVVLHHVIQPDIKLQYTVLDEDIPVVTNGIVLEITRFTLESPKYFAGLTIDAKMEAPEVDPLSEVWNKLHEMMPNMKNLIPEGYEIGISTNMGNKNQFTYYAGVETTEPAVIEGMDNCTIDSGKYIVCKFEAEDFNTLVTDTIYKVYNYMHMWITKKEISVIPKAMELYDMTKPERNSMELWIPIEE